VFLVSHVLSTTLAVTTPSSHVLSVSPPVQLADLRLRNEKIESNSASGSQQRAGAVERKPPTFRVASNLLASDWSQRYFNIV